MPITMHIEQVAIICLRDRMIDRKG